MANQYYLTGTSDAAENPDKRPFNHPLRISPNLVIMSSRYPFLGIILILILQSTIAGAVSERPEDIAARVEARYSAMHSLGFAFQQSTQGDLSGRPQQGDGQAVFLRAQDGAKMRWDYNPPNRQVLVSDGREFQMYFARLEQMIVTPAAALEQELAYGFFTGQSTLAGDFLIETADTEIEALAETEYCAIKLIPRNKRSQIKDIHLFITDDSLIKRLEIRDHFGTVTVLSLSEIRPDALAALSRKQVQEIFRFTPPKGTEILRQE